MKATIFDIQRNSFVDGPGIRTTVFFKGCNLKCKWCHNPESQSAKPQIMFYKDKCTGCGKCREVCPYHLEKCDFCGKCELYCAADARKICGREYTVLEVLSEIVKDKSFYEASEGGVTFSGGEPLMQADFLIECLDLFEGRIHRCVQTSGHCPSDKFKAVAERTDLFLYDIKLVNSEKMHRYTGGDSKLIINNLQHLVNTEKDFIIRIPLIPGVTDTDENISDIISLLKNLDIEYAEAMPYNSMAGAKYPLAGKAFTPDYDHNAKVIIPSEAFEKNGIRLRIL